MIKTDNVYNPINLRPALNQQQVQQKTEDISKNKLEEKTGNQDGDKKEVEKKQFRHRETQKKDIRKEGARKEQVTYRGTRENKKNKEKTVEGKEKKTQGQPGVSKKTAEAGTVQADKSGEKGAKSQDKSAIFSKGTLINLRTTFKELKKELASLAGQGTNQTKTLDLKELLLKTAAPASSDPAMSYPVTREQGTLANLVTGDMKTLINPDLNEKDTSGSDTTGLAEEEIKGQGNSGTPGKAGRKSKNYKHDGKENKINYFFNPLIPREDNKEKLLEYLKNKNQQREELLKSLPDMTPASGERKTRELDPSMIEAELTRRDFMQNKSDSPFGNIYRNYLQGTGSYQDQSDSQKYFQQTGLYPDKSMETMTGKADKNFPDYRQIQGIKTAGTQEKTGTASQVTSKNYGEMTKSMSPDEVEKKLKKTKGNLEYLYNFNKGNWYEVSDESKKSLQAEWEKDIRFNKGALDRLDKKISPENLATLKELAGARKDSGYSKEEIGKILSEKGFKKEDIDTITDAAYKETYKNKLAIINSKDRLYRQGELENRLNEKELELVKKGSKEITSTGMADEVAKLQQEKNDPTLSEEKKKSVEAQYKKAEEKLTYIQDNEKKVQAGITKQEQEYIGLRQADSKNKGVNTAEVPATLLESAKQKYKEANNGQEPPPQYIEDLKKKYSMVDSMYVADVGTDKNKTEDIAKSQETKLAIAMDSKTEDLERFKMSGRAINKNDPANAVNDIKNVSATYMDESRKNCEKDAKEALVARENLDKVKSEINELKQKGATDPGSKQKLAELEAQQSKLEQTCTGAEAKAKQSYDNMMAQLPDSQKEELRKKEEALAKSSQELYKLNTEGKKKETDEYNNYMIDSKVKYTDLTDKLASLDKNSEEYKKTSLELDNFKKEMDGRVKAHNDFEDSFYKKEQEVIGLRKDLDGKRKEYGVGLNLVDLQESYKVNDKTLEGLKGQLTDSDKFKADDKIKFVESLKNNDFSKESLTNILKEKGFSDKEIDLISKNSNPSTYASEKKAEAVKGMYTGMVPPGTNSFEDIMAEAKVTKELANSKIAWTELEDAKKIGTTITVTSDITSMGGESNNVKGFAQGTKIVLSKDAPAGTAIHETGHIMENYGIMDVDYKVQQLYNNKKETGGDFATAYSAENKKEYFSEGLKLYSSPEGKQILETKDKDLYSMLQNLEKQGKLSEAKNILEQAGKAKDNVGTILGQAGDGTPSATDTLTDKLSKVSIWQLNQENSAGLLNKLDGMKSELKLSDEEYTSIKSSLEKDKVISEESLSKLGLKQEEIDTLKSSSKKMDLSNNIFTAGLLNELKEGPKKEREDAINNYDTVKKFEELQKKNPELYDYLSDKKDITEDTLKNNLTQGKEAYGSTKLFDYMNSLQEKNKEKPGENTLKDDLTNGMKSYYDADPKKKEELKQNNPKLYAYVEELEKNGIKTSEEALKEPGKLLESYDKRLALKDKDPKLYACLEQMEKKGQLTGDMSKLSEETSKDLGTYKKGSELKNNNSELYNYLSDLQNGKEVKSDDPAKGIYTYMSKLDKDGKLYKDGAINKDYIQNEIDLYSDKTKSKYLYENSPELFDYLLNQEKTQNEKFSEKLKNYKDTCTWLSDKPFVKEQAGNAIKLLEAAGNDIKTIDEASRYSLSEYRDAKLLNKEEKSREQVKDKTGEILAGWRNISIDKDKLSKLDSLKDVTWYSYDDKNMEKLKGKIPADTLEKIKPLINNKMLTTEELQETLKNKNFNLKDEDIQTILKNGNTSKIGTEKLEQVKKDIGNQSMSRDELIRKLQNSGLSKEQAARAAKEIGMSEKDFIDGNKSTKKTNPEITVNDKLIKNFDQMTAELKGKIPQAKLDLLKQELEKNKGKTMSLEEGMKLLDKYNFTKEEKSLLLKRMYPNLPDNFEIPDSGSSGSSGSGTWNTPSWNIPSWNIKPKVETWKPVTIWDNESPKEGKTPKEGKITDQLQEGKGTELITEELKTSEIKIDTSFLSGLSEETRKSLEEANKTCTKDFQKTLGMKDEIDSITKEMSGLKDGDPKLSELKAKKQELQLKYEGSLKETKQEYQKMLSMLPAAQRKELEQSEKKASTSAVELSRLHEQKEKENKSYSTEMNGFRQERQELQNKLKGMDPKSEQYIVTKQKLDNIESKIDTRVQEHNKFENTLHSKEKETIQLRQNLEAKREEFGVSINSNRQLTPEEQKKAKAVNGMYLGTVPKAGSAVEDMLTRASVTKELAKSSMSVKELEEARDIGTTITVASKEKGIASLGGTEKGTQGFTQGTRIVLAERAVTGTATHEMAHIMDKSKIMMEDNIRVGDRVMNVGDRVNELYEEKKKSGGFANDYSATNKQEYFAEGMRLYNSEEGRKQLQTKDPKLFEVMKTLESDGKIETLKSNLDKTGEALNLESYNDCQKRAGMEKNYPETVKYLDYMKEHEPEKFNNLRLSDNEGVKRIKEDIGTGKFKGTEGEIAEAITNYRDAAKMEELKQSRPEVYNYVQDLAGKGDLEKIQKGLDVKQELSQKLEQFNGPNREKLKESDPRTFKMLEEMDKHGKLEDFSLTMKSSDTDLLKSAFKKEEVKTRETVQIKTSDILNNWDKNPKDKIAATLGTEKDYFVVNEGKHGKLQETSSEKLYNAMSGTDEKTISTIMQGRTRTEREAILKDYNQRYGSDIYTDIQKEMPGTDVTKMKQIFEREDTVTTEWTRAGRTSGEQVNENPKSGITGDAKLSRSETPQTGAEIKKEQTGQTQQQTADQYSSHGQKNIATETQQKTGQKDISTGQQVSGGEQAQQGTDYSQQQTDPRRPAWSNPQISQSGITSQEQSSVSQQQSNTGQQVQSGQKEVPSTQSGQQAGQTSQQTGSQQSSNLFSQHQTGQESPVNSMAHQKDQNDLVTASKPQIFTNSPQPTQDMTWKDNQLQQSQPAGSAWKDGQTQQTGSSWNQQGTQEQQGQNQQGGSQQSISSSPHQSQTQQTGSSWNQQGTQEQQGQNQQGGSQQSTSSPTHQSQTQQTGSSWNQQGTQEQQGQTQQGGSQQGTSSSTHQSQTQQTGSSWNQQGKQEQQGQIQQGSSQQSTSSSTHQSQTQQTGQAAGIQQTIQQSGPSFTQQPLSQMVGQVPGGQQTTQQNPNQKLSEQSSNFSTSSISVINPVSGRDITWKDSQYQQPQQPGSAWKDSNYEQPQQPSWNRQQTEDTEHGGITISSPSVSPRMSQNENGFSWKDQTTSTGTQQDSVKQQTSAAQQDSSSQKTIQQDSVKQQTSAAQQDSSSQKTIQQDSVKQQTSAAQQDSSSQKTIQQTSTAQQASAAQQDSSPQKTIQQTSTAQQTSAAQQDSSSQKTMQQTSTAQQTSAAQQDSSSQKTMQQTSTAQQTSAAQQDSLSQKTMQQTSTAQQTSATQQDSSSQKTTQQAPTAQQISAAQQDSSSQKTTQQAPTAQQISAAQQDSSSQKTTQQTSVSQQSYGTQQKSEQLLQTGAQGAGQKTEQTEKVNLQKTPQSIQSSEQRLQKASYDGAGNVNTGIESFRAASAKSETLQQPYQKTAGDGKSISAIETGSASGQSKNVSNQSGITKQGSSGYTGQVSYQGPQRTEQQNIPANEQVTGKQTGTGRGENIKTEGQGMSAARGESSKETASNQVKKENIATQMQDQNKDKKIPLWNRTGETPEKPSLIGVPRELRNIKDFDPKKQEIVEIKTREIMDKGKLGTLDTQRAFKQDWNKESSGSVATKTDRATKTESIRRAETKTDGERIRPEQALQGTGTLSTIGKAFKMLGNIVESIKPALTKEVDKIKSSIPGLDKIKSSITGQQVTAKSSSIMGQQVDPGKVINADNLFKRVNAQISEAINLFDKKNSTDKLSFQEKGAFITKEMIGNRKKRLDPESLEATEAVMAWDKTDYVAAFPTEVHQDANLELKRLCQMCQIVVNVDMVLCPSCAKLRRGLYDEMEPYFTRMALIRKQKLDEKNKAKGGIQEVSGIVVKDRVELSTETTAVSTSSKTANSRSTMKKLDENTLWCHKKFTLPEDCKVQASPSWAKDYISNKTNNLEHSLSLSTLSPSFELLAKDSVEFPLDINSLTTRLNESISRDNVVEENRTSWKKEGIKRRERIYSQGLVETVTKWDKSDIKQKQVRDRAGTFDFSHITKGKSIESNIFNCGDLYIEESKNYDTDTSVWKYRGKNRFLVHCSFPGENGNRVKYTRLDEGNISRIGIDYDDGRRHIEIQDPTAGKKASITTFSERSCQMDYSSPSMTDKTIIQGSGRGINIKTNSDGEKISLAWMPLNEVIAYKKEYTDGTVNRCYYYDNKATRQIVSYPDSNSCDLLELPGEATKKVYKYNDGTGEEVTVFEDNKTRRTVKYNDSSVLSEVSYGEDMFKLGMKYDDGTSYMCKNWGNGTTQQCFCWPNAGMARVTTGFDNDSIIERKTLYGNGSSTVEIKTENWESDITKIPEEVMNRNILESSLFDLIASPSVRTKLMEDPFHNPLLTIDTQLWAQIQLLQSHGKKALIKSIEKIHSLKNSGEQKSELSNSSDNENLKNYFNAIKHINNTIMDTNPE